MLADQWFRETKLTMSTFLQSLYNSFRALKNGVDIEIQKTIHLKSYSAVERFFLPARSLVCNYTQYSGKFSCWKCVQPGKTAGSGKGHVHVFLFDPTKPNGPTAYCAWLT